MKIKKFNFTLLLFIICFVRCELIIAAPVDEKRAREIAINWFEHINNDKISSTRKSQAVHVKSTMKKATNQFTSLYIYNFSGGGFVLVSGNDSSIPVIGYSKTSEITEDIQCPALSALLESYSKQIDWLNANNTDSSNTIKSWKKIQNKSFNNKLRSGVDEVKPLIKNIKWGQKYPYNSQCPDCFEGPGKHCLVGCVAIAMGIIMKYWNRPLHYDWKNMPDQLTETSSDTQIDAVARLLADCGDSIDMDYGPYGSSARSKDVEHIFDSDIGYLSSAYLERYDYSDDQWRRKIKNELKNGRPVYYAGYSFYYYLLYGLFYGHAFVCDGYDSNDRFHINWGWNGDYNGYFSLDDLSPGTSEFNIYQRALINIQPADFNLPSPENIEIKEISLNNIKIAWDNNEALYYRVYRNSVDNSETAIPLGDWKQIDGFIDSNIRAYQTYYYWIKSSYNASGLPVSAFSNVISIKPLCLDMNNNQRVELTDAIPILKQTAGLIDNSEMTEYCNLKYAVSVLKIVSGF